MTSVNVVYNRDGWSVRRTSDDANIVFDAIGLPTAAAITAIYNGVELVIRDRPVYFRFKVGALIPLLRGLGALRSYLNYKGALCATINLLNSFGLCSLRCVDDQGSIYTHGNELNNHLWSEQQMPGQQKGYERRAEWVVDFAGRPDKKVFRISWIGDVKFESVQSVYMGLEQNPESIHLISNVRTEFIKVATWYHWVLGYIYANENDGTEAFAMRLFVYMRLAVWFDYLAKFPNTILKDEWYIFSKVERPADLPSFSVMPPETLLNSPSYTSNSRELCEAFDRFFPCDVTDAPIAFLFDENYHLKLDEFFSMYGHALEQSEITAIKDNIRINNWNQKQIHAYLMARLPKKTAALQSPVPVAPARQQVVPTLSHQSQFGQAPVGQGEKCYADQISSFIMTYFYLEELDEPIAVASNEDPNRVMGAFLDYVADAILAISDAKKHDAIHTFIERGMTGSELHEYLVRHGAQQPVTSGKSDSPSMPQPQSRQAPTAQRRGPCDEIAELFKINDNDLVIIESGEASKLTLAQISIKLHEIFKSLLDEKLINIIVDSIFEYAWTLKDVDTFTSQWTQLPPCIMAYFDLNKLNEKITVTSGEENPEKVIGDSLDKVLESVDFVISSDTRSEVVTKIIDGMTGSELHKYLINLVHPGGQQPVTSSKSDSPSMPPPQPQSRQAPTAQRRGPCDEIAELFKINDNDLVIIESGEASKLTLAQISIKLHEIFKSLLDEKFINIIVASISEYAWTLKDVDAFAKRWAQLSPCIMAYFDLNKLNEKITVTSGEENPEKVIGDSLDKVLESVAFVISSDTRSEVVTKIIDGMTGSELHKYLINLVHPGGQQPVTSGKSDPLPTASQVQLPQVVSPSDHGLIQAFGANHNSAPNGYVRIHARCDNNCLFNALAIALTLYGTRSRNITGELCAILEIMWELAITGTTNRAQNIVQLAANLESRLQRTFVDTRLIRRAAAAEEEIQRALGFEPDTLAACKTEQQGNSTQLAVTDITAERLIRELWHQTQLLAQHYLRELLAKFELPNPLPASLTTSLAAIQGDIESGNRRRLTRGLSPRPTAGSIEEYRRNYTAQIGQWGEIPDIILIAICFECPVYVVNQGAMNVIAFGPDGSLIENPNLHDIRDVAIVFWNNGTNATDGSHWDLCVPADAGVHQIWHATD